MLGAGYVIGTTTVQIAIWVGLLVQGVGIPGSQHLRDHPLEFRFGTVAIDHAVWLGQLCHFVDPGFQWSCHPDFPAGLIALRHQLEQTHRLFAVPETLRQSPDLLGAVQRLDSAIPTDP